MSDYEQPKWQYQLVVDFRVDLLAKNQLHSHSVSGDVARMCNLILGSLGMPGYAHQINSINL